MPQQFEFPGKGPGQPIRIDARMGYIAAAVLLGLWLLSGIFTVAPDEKGVILRFGRLQEVVLPGLHYHFPSPIESRIVRSFNKVFREEVGFKIIDSGPPAKYRAVPEEALMITGDINIADVQMVVQYRVGNVTDALFNVEGLGVFDRGKLVHDASEAALRQIVGRHNIEEVLTLGRLNIQTEVQKKLQEIFEVYRCGLIVEMVQLQSVAVPEQVSAAFKDVASAKEDSVRMVNEALGYQEQVVPRAKGEAEQAIKTAQAYKVERVRRATGDAERFTTVLEEYRKAPEITETRLYLETMEKILPRMRKYIVENDEGGGLINLLNLSEVK